MNNDFITRALIFAKEFLGIKDPNFCCKWSCAPPRQDKGTLGYFCSQTGILYFVNTPDLDTIFHEAAHYWQWENGETFENLAYYKTGNFDDYWNDATEIQARDLAFKARVAYNKYRKMLKINNRQYNFE